MAGGKAYLAVDIGASSGRHVLGRLNDGRIELEEVYRFENGGVDLAGQLVWDLPRQWMHLLHGFRSAAQSGAEIVSAGVDTWGVDFALLGRGDTLLSNPGHYRDARTAGIMERAFDTVPREEIFAHTGLQFMQFNTLYQLLAMQWADSPLLDAAERLLLMPDLFHWLMTGVKCNELTDASTTQFYNPVRGDWARELLARFDLPTHILGEIVSPGTSLGPLRAALIEETGLPSGMQVVLPGTHDTASAVMAVPAAGLMGQSPDWCYISLGTWALMGIESPRPVVDPSVLARNFTNEGGVGRTTRLLKNICGLWLIQECRRTWNLAGKDWDWEDLNRMAAAAQPRVTLIDPDAADFLAPSDMPEAIRAFASRTGQPVPETEGAILRTALESLALKFRYVLGMCEELAGRRIETIHIVGGGTRNRQLCQMTADCCDRVVMAGPVEATAIGNIMMQAVAAGDVADIPEARDVIRRSFDTETYEPHDGSAWDEAYATFQGLL